MKKVILFFSLLFIGSNSYSSIDNGSDLRSTFFNSPNQLKKMDFSDLTIAVFDNGFGNYKTGSDDLPKNTKAVIKGPFQNKSPDMTDHGLDMAKIVWETLGKPKGKKAPQILLFRTNGITNLKHAIEEILIDKHAVVDIVLFSQNYETYGNFDGSGFINYEINKLIRHGIQVVNAVGNYHNHVHHGGINPKKNGYLKFNKIAPLTDKSGTIKQKTDCKDDELCFYNHFDNNKVEIILSWNDFTDDMNYRTQKDLDLFLMDAKGTKQLKKSDKLQKGLSPDKENKNLSAHARERLTETLDRGWYRIKIKAKSLKDKGYKKSDLTINEIIAKTFDKDFDEFRITLKSQKTDAILFQDRTTKFEIMTPADNANVISVGDTSYISASGETTDYREKPDVMIRSLPINFSNGKSSLGTSSSAAVFAGLIAYIIKKDPYWNFINSSDIRSYGIQNVFDNLDQFKSYDEQEQSSKARTATQKNYTDINTSGIYQHLSLCQNDLFDLKRFLRTAKIEKDLQCMIAANGKYKIFGEIQLTTKSLPGELVYSLGLSGENRSKRAKLLKSIIDESTTDASKTIITVENFGMLSIRY